MPLDASMLCITSTLDVALVRAIADARHQAPIRARDLRARTAFPLGRRARGGFSAAGRRLQLHGSAASAEPVAEARRCRGCNRLNPAARRALFHALYAQAQTSRSCLALLPAQYSASALYRTTRAVPRTSTSLSRTYVITCTGESPHTYYSHFNAPIFHTDAISNSHSHHRRITNTFFRDSLISLLLFLLLSEWLRPFSLDGRCLHSNRSYSRRICDLHRHRLLQGPLCLGMDSQKRHDPALHRFYV